MRMQIERHLWGAQKVSGVGEGRSDAVKPSLAGSAETEHRSRDGSPRQVGKVGREARADGLAGVRSDEESK
jgi:hypothetical protein